MESYINLLLKTELTIIPRLLEKYFGNYYNNTLCNGATWMFLIWHFLHIAFEDFLNALLKRMKYKEYKRVRLQRSLWYLGFYATACIYCTATLIRNNSAIIQLDEPFDSTNSMSSQLILGFIVLLTFYLHSAFWEILKYENGIKASSYLTLFFLFLFSYFLRFMEGTFRLTILIAFNEMSLEIARCFFVLVKRDDFKGNILLNIFFAISFLALLINYLIVVPILFGYPLVVGFSPGVSLLLTFLLTWLIIETYTSVLTKVAIHFLQHNPEDGDETCDFFECSLFPPRSDVTYNLKILRKEMKKREATCISMRKPKNRNVVFQTLKCMVAIKRKLNEKRQNNSPEKDTLNEDSGKANVMDGEKMEKEEDIVGARLEFNINEKNKNDFKCKTD